MGLLLVLKSSRRRCPRQAAWAQSQVEGCDVDGGVGSMHAFFFQFYLICEKERKLFSVVNAIWAACPPHPRKKVYCTIFFKQRLIFHLRRSSTLGRAALLRCCAVLLFGASNFRCSIKDHPCSFCTKIK